MRRRIGCGIILALSLLAPRPAAANLLCDWFNRCLYESPGFRFTVMDKETGQPLADVHALAEWVQYGRHGTNGPLMVQDAVSGPEGVLTFPTWGPIRGSRVGLVLNQDPGITLFKPGYKVLTIFNAIPVGTGETDRVRGFYQNGQTFALEPFRGSSEEWVKELGMAAYPATLGHISDDQLLRFRIPYLNRKHRIWGEKAKLPRDRRDVEDLFWSLERSIRFFERGHK